MCQDFRSRLRQEKIRSEELSDLSNEKLRVAQIATQQMNAQEAQMKNVMERLAVAEANERIATEQADGFKAEARAALAAQAGLAIQLQEVVVVL